MKRRRPDKRVTRHPASSPRHRLPDGGYALSGLRGFSSNGFSFDTYLTATVLIPAEIGEPKRE
ncbi:hypothetical protein [Kosakonia sp. 1610]|uniref:hypothetical protein n=1 Tax=Kosakonia sp. 1610 TaxID=3156426 RepID=UPI003D1ADC46